MYKGKNENYEAHTVLKYRYDILVKLAKCALTNSKDTCAFMARKKDDFDNLNCFADVCGIKVPNKCEDITLGYKHPDELCNP